MAKDSQIIGTGGIGFCSMLVLILITLKLCHVIDWSWWWVFSPWWISAAIVAASIMIALAILTSIAIVTSIWK